MNITELCVNCKKNNSCTMCWKTSKKKCPHFIQKTNADRIRSMTDEELAVLLSDPCECSVDPNEDGYRECGNKFCIEYLLNWLQSPVETLYG